VRLLEDRAQELRERHAIAFRITGIASRRLGWIADPNGIPRSEAISPAGAIPETRNSKHETDVRSWLADARADVLFEATALNVENGQPAVDHIRAALEHGAHAITANKGPVVHAYPELRDLAAARGKRFLFESTVMDGVPIFSLFDQLPAIRLNGFHGILNSTTNVILSEMENGLSFYAALKKAQEIGVAEADATHDIDGWDAAAKTAALITVLMLSSPHDLPVRLDQIDRQGIRGLSAEAVRAAKQEGKPYKLVCRARRVSSSGNSAFLASVRPEQIPLTDPMAHVTGTSSIVSFDTDIFPGLVITEENPGLYATAYGMLADFVRAVTASS